MSILQGGIALKSAKRRRFIAYILLSLAILLIVVAVGTLVHTFSKYNALSLSRQDSQLVEIAQAVDTSMHNQLNSLRENLRYVITRRGFLLAEQTWISTGNSEDLLNRMQENLVSSSLMVHAMLAITGENRILSSSANDSYYFPDGMEGTLLPCFGGDGSMYLALFEEGQHARYAALVDMEEWYASLAHFNVKDSIRLMLLGSQERILLHTWMGQSKVNIIDDLTEANCDLHAVRHMLSSRTASHSQTHSYHLTYPGDTYAHEMRMTTIPLPLCTNGYFIVGLTSDYDEIIVPMQSAAWHMIISSAILMTGVLMMLLTSFQLVLQNRQRDVELERLIQRNEETRKLLEKTNELAHHQRLETIGTLTASIAHEFNNLLTPIMGYSILTLEGLPDGCDDLADNVSEIYEASRKAKNIVSRLNDLSRRSDEEHFTALSLPNLVEKALNVAAPALPARVSTALNKPETDLIVSGSETKLSQLLLNLILNAYHAMETTGGTLTLALSAEEEFAVVRVQDEGIGIPEEALPLIFEPFFTTKESGRGTGLGLAIVHQIVQAHHGDIKVHSITGQGTTFILSLPLAYSVNADIA